MNLIIPEFQLQMQLRLLPLEKLILQIFLS